MDSFRRTFCFSNIYKPTTGKTLEDWQNFSKALVKKVCTVRLLVEEVLVINISRVLTEHLETTHTRSQKEASNISLIETLHPFNFNE